MKQRAIFVDRDGVINVNRDDYVKTWDEFVFLPGALDGLRALAALPAPVIVITNQSAINRGLTTRANVDDIHARMVLRIRQDGGRVDGVFLCPHRPDEHCDCRKPKPGLFLQAAEQFNLDLPGSFFIGDNETDALAALNINATPLLVKTGFGAQHAARLQRANIHGVRLFEDLSSVAAWLVESFNMDGQDEQDKK
jgi:histidinol-phosphate phosphatase family protein